MIVVENTIGPRDTIFVFTIQVCSTVGSDKLLQQPRTYLTGNLNKMIQFCMLNKVVVVDDTDVDEPTNGSNPHEESCNS